MRTLCHPSGTRPFCIWKNMILTQRFDKMHKRYSSLYLNTFTEENEAFYGSRKNFTLLSKFNFVMIQRGNSFKFWFRRSAKYCKEELVPLAIKARFKISSLFQFSNFTYLLTMLTLRMIAACILKALKFFLSTLSRGKMEIMLLLLFKRIKATSYFNESESLCLHSSQ